MKHNTDTLGYKLLSGKLKENRKHSEQLNKYIAGLLDADGCLGLTFNPYKGRFMINLTFIFLQALSNDPDGLLVKAIQSFYNIGSISYRNLKGDNNYSSVAVWTMGSKDFLKFYFLIKNHLRIKGTHWDNLVWLYMELKGCYLSEENIIELKEFSKYSRKNSRWLKQPKHLSFAWFAGYLDGDGHYRLRHRKKFIKKYGKCCNSNELSMSIACDKDDSHVLDKIQVDFGGHQHHHKKGHFIWTLALGKNSTVWALKLLKQLRKYCCLEKKYSIISDMIQFHEDYQQRLNKDISKE